MEMERVPNFEHGSVATKQDEIHTGMTPEHGTVNGYFSVVEEEVVDLQYQTMTRKSSFIALQANLIKHSNM